MGKVLTEEGKLLRKGERLAAQEHKLWRDWRMARMGFRSGDDRRDDRWPPREAPAVMTSIKTNTMMLKWMVGTLAAR